MKSLLNLVLLIMSIFLLSSCANGLNDLKTDPNSKLFSISNSKKNRRMPISNKKFIEKAKVNILNKEVDDDDDLDNDDESQLGYLEDPKKNNRQIYKKMLQEDLRKKQVLRSRLRNYQSQRGEEVHLCDMDEANDSAKVQKTDHLEREIEDLRKLLLETKSEIHKVKCPYSENEAISNQKKKLDKTSTLEEGSITPMRGAMSSSLKS